MVPASRPNPFRNEGIPIFLLQNKGYGLHTGVSSASHPGTSALLYLTLFALVPAERHCQTELPQTGGSPLYLSLPVPWFTGTLPIFIPAIPMSFFPLTRNQQSPQDLLALILQLLQHCMADKAETKEGKITFNPAAISCRKHSQSSFF